MRARGRPASADSNILFIRSVPPTARDRFNYLASTTGQTQGEVLSALMDLVAEMRKVPTTRRLLAKHGLMDPGFPK